MAPLFPETNLQIAQRKDTKTKLNPFPSSVGFHAVDMKLKDEVLTNPPGTTKREPRVFFIEDIGYTYQKFDIRPKLAFACALDLNEDEDEKDPRLSFDNTSDKYRKSMKQFGR